MNPAEASHLVLTDSGLGGLSLCATLERRLRRRDIRLTYLNAWPFEGIGYNDLPTVPERAEVFDRALCAMAALAPDQVLVDLCCTHYAYVADALRAALEAALSRPALVLDPKPCAAGALVPEADAGSPDDGAAGSSAMSLVRRSFHRSECCGVVIRLRNMAAALRGSVRSFSRMPRTSSPKLWMP